MKKNNIVFECVLVFAIIVLLVVLIVTVIDINDMKPRKVCYEEVEIIKFETGVNKSQSFPLDSNIVCEPGVNVKIYKYIGCKTIYTYLSEPHKICLIEITKEICEIETYSDRLMKQ